MKSERVERMAKENSEIEKTLGELEESLFTLREAYIQSRQDEQQQAELRQQRRELRKKGKKEKQEAGGDNKGKDSKKDPIKAELRLLERQIDDLDHKIASRFVDITIFQDQFWQIVRFAGLGLVIGWILKTIVG
jgi:hypothetical protein